MNEFELHEFRWFLELPECNRFEYLTNTKLSLWQKLWIKHINDWWSSILEANPDQKPYVLWESIYKGRF
jgi:hypothetical protein